MSRPDSCDLGCGAEERLDLVAAEEHDALAGSVRESQARGEALRDAVRPLTSAPPDVQAAYLALQASARALLREQGAPPPFPEPARVFTTWWCPRCGGVDAPQPCLGICVWRPFDWVAAEDHEQLRSQMRETLAEEHRLRALLGRVAAVTPRPGQWGRGWAALADAAAMR
jgi:hypothetical protein